MRPNLTIRSLLKDESGQAIIPVAILMVGVFGFIGLAIDIGQVRLVQRQLQAKADAAALAGALEVGACGAIPDCATMQAAAKSAITENGVAAGTFLQNCAVSAASGVLVTLNNPPCAAGSIAADPNYGNASYVEAVATKLQPTYFASVLGIPSLNVVARAEAAARSPSACIWSLDPSGANAFTVAVLAQVYSPNCGIVVESSSSAGMSCSLLASVTASQIQVVGNYFSLLCFISPNPVMIKTPNPADPLAWLPTPTIPACGLSVATPYTGATNTVNVLLGQTVTFNPGSYCGGINIALGGNATFNPGTYVLKSTNGSAGLTINCLATVSGSGVTFYNYGPNSPINMVFTSLLSGGVNLTAPTSGTYSGILFFQDPGNTRTSTIIGATSWNTVLEGAYYFPSATVNFGFDGVVNYSLLVAKDIAFLALSDGVNPLKTGANNSNDFSSLSNGSPLQKTSAGLVQ